MKATGWLKGLEVTGGGSGVVPHAGLALLRALAGNIGLTGRLSRASASRRLLVHDRGRCWWTCRARSPGRGGTGRAAPGRAAGIETGLRQIDRLTAGLDPLRRQPGMLGRRQSGCRVLQVTQFGIGSADYLHPRSPALVRTACPADYCRDVFTWLDLHLDNHGDLHLPFE